MKKYEKIIINYYKECITAEEEAEKAHDADKKSREKREAYQYCFAQSEALVELMEQLGIDYMEV